MGGIMKKFWKSKNSSPRSWEEITAPKTDEELEGIDDTSCIEDKDTDNIFNNNNTGNIKKDEEIPSTHVKKVRKKGSEKFDKMIDNLDFDPVVYYGWGDGKVDAWMEKLTRLWNVVASVMWFIFGSITFAPILFTANKLDKFFNDKKKSFLIATAIYVFIAVFVVFVIIF